jgi:hypothetical protein
MLKRSWVRLFRAFLGVALMIAVFNTQALAAPLHFDSSNVRLEENRNSLNNNVKVLGTQVSAGPLHFDSPKVWLEGDLLGISFEGEGDFNGDGKNDLFLSSLQSSGQAQTWVYISTGSAFLPPKLWSSEIPYLIESDRLDVTGDVNGDGKDDIVIFTHGNGRLEGSANVYVALSTGNEFRYDPNFVWNDGFCISEQICRVADVNGDGKSDLVAFTPITGLVWISLSLGNKFGSNAIWHNYFCIQNEVCTVSDINGDRKADLILFKPHATGVEKGNVLVAFSTGQNFGTAQYGHGYFCIDDEQCFVADLNGDRKSDILLSKPDFRGSILETFLVALSNSKQFINTNPFEWGSTRDIINNAEGIFIIGLRDVTGDRRADLLVLEQLHGGKYRMVVYATTDQKQTQNPQNPQNPSDPPTAEGWREVDLYNCDPNQDRYYYWMRDLTTGSTDQRGPIDAMYSESGYCPDPNDPPEKVTLTSGHSYEIIVVDPQSIGCDENNPDIQACRKHDVGFIGDDKGGIFSWIVSAQSP